MAENELGGPFADHHTEVVPVIQHLQLPEGIVGPFVLDLEVRCFLVRGSTGLVLVDAGPEGGAPEIGQALGRVGATWSDVTDVILTHSHADHVGFTRGPRRRLGPGGLESPTCHLLGRRTRYWGHTFKGAASPSFGRR